VAGDEEIARLAGSGFDTRLRFSPDGQYLAVWSTHLDVWKLGGAEPVAVLHRSMGNFFGIDFSADNRECVIGDANGSFTLYDLTFERPPVVLPGGGKAARLAFQPQRQSVAVAHDTGVEIRDLDTGKLLAALATPDSIECLAWNADGKTLGVSCDDEMIYLWNPESGTPPLTLEGLGSGGIKIAFNHAGNLLASSGWGGLLRLWDPQSCRQLFTTQSGMVPQFSRDDRFLAGDLQSDGRLGLWEVAAGGGEYRTLLRHPSEGKGIYDCLSIDKTGSFLAVGMQDGFCLWDLASGTELAFVRLPGCYSVLFEPSGAVLASSSAGLLRWPIRQEGADLAHIGPPVRLPVPGPICHIAASADGRVIAVSQFDEGGSVLHADHPNAPVRLWPHPDARYVAVSPDGQWVVTGSHNGTQVKVWNSRTGKIKAEFPSDGSYVAFSPDGKWLGTTSGGLQLWSTESWKMQQKIGGGTFVFSPDSEMLVVETGYGVLRLVNPETGKDYARLEDPNQDRARYIRFSPDGTQLVATNDGSCSVHVWNLPKIRKQLAQMGLDWHAPAYAPAVGEKGKAMPIRVDLGNLEGLLKGTR